MNTLMLSTGLVVREPNAETIFAALSQCDTSNPVVITLKNNHLKNYYVLAEGSDASGFVMEFKLSAAEHYRSEPPYLTIHEVIQVCQEFVAGTPGWVSRFPYRRVPRQKRSASPSTTVATPQESIRLTQPQENSGRSDPILLGQLKPTTIEHLALPSGKVVQVPKCCPTFNAWRGVPPEDTYGGKPVLDFDGRPAFAELAILWSLERDGWSGVWIDTYRRKFGKGYWDSQPVKLPPERSDLLEGIYRRSGSWSGAFDVYCWRGEEMLFAESKRFKRDAIRDTQLIWLQAALDEGVRPAQFLIVEWTLR
jgi:hypothetical protein